MRIISSFKLKLAFYYTIVVLSILVIFTVVSIKLIESSLFEEIDRSLETEAVWIQSMLEDYQIQNFDDNQIKSNLSRRSRLSPRKQFIEIYNPQGYIYFRSINLLNEQLKPYIQQREGISTIKFLNNIEIRLLTIWVNDFEIIIGHPLTDVNVAISEILSSLLFLIPLGLFLIFFGGIFIVNKFTKPLKKLNKYIDNLLKQPLDQEVEKIDVIERDELGNLIFKINNVTEKLRNSMRQSLSFSSLAAHELRSPLAIVRNQLENVMRSDVHIKEIKDTLTSVYDELLRMNRVINDLLSIGTLQAGTLKLELENIDLKVLLTEFYEEATLLCRKKNITVVLKNSETSTVYIDILRIRQVLFNLLDNAIRNTPENGRIRLGYEKKGKYFIISFSDTGTGIPESLINKIFNPFKTGITSKQNGMGSGLGLALVKSVIDAHNGEISVKSIVGEGTTFKFTLPISEN